MLSIFKSKAKSEDNAPKTNRQLLLKLLQDRSRTTEELRQHIAHQTLTAALSQLEAQGIIYKMAESKGLKDISLCGLTNPMKKCKSNAAK